jgi:hypothetical protein
MDPTGSINGSRRERGSAVEAAVSHNRWGFGASACTSRSQSRCRAQSTRDLGESRIRRTNQYFEQQTAMHQMSRVDSSKHSSSFRFQSPQLSMIDEQGKEDVEETEPRGRGACRHKEKLINPRGTRPRPAEMAHFWATEVIETREIAPLATRTKM